ncbi:hypothetical protein [Pseudomonas sp. RGM2987]|uniref:hypothetical protein n=1 Tax=Pseudomonas sp. RGM2987 TaxID=2930090 RepID=UPI001FD67C73|nr:hypothetical protein [Pseudomonas sp. RGM2987]MCJ8207729.1 hypothetical protein [Pseudomonas sp. RGM2987]
MPLIQVEPWGEGQGDFVEIDDFDFNPEFHRLFSADSSGSDKLTAAQLKDKLTALGIGFRSNASRDSLQELLDAHEAVVAIKAKLTEKGIEFAQDADLATLQALLPAEE